MSKPSETKRCGWVSSDPVYIEYHDKEWGKVSRDEAYLFEMLNLEGQQAGLSWITILKKRDGYRSHFFKHSIADIAKLPDSAIQAALEDPGVVRHRLKLLAIRENARAWVNMKDAGDDPVSYLWASVGGLPKRNSLVRYTDGATTSDAAEALSKALKKKGFKFVGPKCIYSLMQAVGMVDDHENDCHCKRPAHPGGK